MNAILFLLPLFIFGIGTAYAQPLDEITTTVLEYDGSASLVNIAWNHDDAVSYYEIGCVSCIPNFSESTSDNSIVLQNITSLKNGLAVLYVIAYHDNSEMITVKQIFVDLR